MPWRARYVPDRFRNIPPVRHTPRVCGAPVESTGVSAIAETQTQPDPFADAAERAMEAIREAVAQRRRLGLHLTVDRGQGVERIA